MFGLSNKNFILTSKNFSMYKSCFPSIIIADEQPLFCTGVAFIIKSRNRSTKIFQTQSGIEIIKELERQIYDIVIIGNKLGELDGIEAISVIKQKFPSVKIIGICQFLNPYFIYHLYSLGANGFCLKSLAATELIEVIKKVVVGKKYFPLQVINSLIKKENGLIQNGKLKSIHIQDRFKKIIFLICKGKSSRQIARMLKVSSKTVERDRLELNILTGAQGVAGIIRFGITTGIIDDGKLISFFESMMKSN
jgi:DNA-binding NarL/FixJ family response regulator